MDHLRPVFVLLALTGFTHAAEPSRSVVFPEGAAVLVNGEVITENAVRAELGSSTCINVPIEQRAQARTQAVQFLVDRLLIEQHLRKTGCKVTDGEIDERLDKVRADLQMSKLPLTALEGALPLIRADIAVELRWSRYVEKKATDQELRKLFQAKRNQFDDSRVHARHILIKPASNNRADVVKTTKELRELRSAIEKEVSAALARLPANADQDKDGLKLLQETFGKYAREKSVCPSKAQGGDLGSFPRLGVVVAPFAAAAFALEPGQISDVVQTEFGCHLILVTDWTPGREVAFDKVEDAVKEAYGDWLKARLVKQLRQKATVQIRTTDNAPSAPFLGPTRLEHVLIPLMPPGRTPEAPRGAM